MCLYIDHKSAIESDKGILKKHFNTIFPAATLPQLTDDICVIYISKLFLLLLMCVWLQLQPVSFNITPLKKNQILNTIPFYYVSLLLKL